MYLIGYTFLCFLIYAIMGWMMEIIVCSIPVRKLVDRGFLIGPYCPIYGIGSVCILFVLESFRSDPLLVFVTASFICAFIEYFTSFAMEKLFHARWWDYSNELFNINGRITLTNTILFGLLGLLLVYFIHPWINTILGYFSHATIIITAIMLAIIFMIDVVTTIIIVYKLKTTHQQLRKDSTEEITKKVREILSKTLLSRRLINAFPNIRFK